MRNASIPLSRYAPTASGDLARDVRDGRVSTAAVHQEVLELFDAAAPSLRR